MKKTSDFNGALRFPHSQHGVVLMIALIMLIAMTLGALALVRSTASTNIIAGNLAFQQSATNSSDSANETAISWLEANNSGVNLQVDAVGYRAARLTKPPTQTWDDNWRSTLSAVASSQTTDTSGNTSRYVIDRLCNSTGAPNTSVNPCSTPQSSVTTTGSSKGTSVVALQYGNQIYYRITTRVVGPRNTVSYVQTIVAL